MIKRPGRLEKIETNRSAYSKIYKAYLVSLCLVSCTLCPYHRGHDNSSRLQKNWKKFRKTQWKENSRGRM